MAEAELAQKIDASRPMGEAISARIGAEIDKLGFAPGTVPAPAYDRLRFRTEKDPSTGEAALVGDWFDSNGRRLGNVQFHPGGTFYAEYDVVRPHPTRPAWFVEGITVWGRDGHIKAEPKLLPVPQ